jgi:hypothetical protein
MNTGSIDDEVGAPDPTRPGRAARGPVPDIEAAYRQGLEVVQLIESATTAHVPADRHAQALSAMAAVSRCRSLLLGTIALDRAGRGDLLGVPLRALLEVWYFGVIALLGEASDLDRLEADHRHWKNELAKALPGVAPEAGPEQRFSVWQRAKRADQLVAQIGEPRGLAVEWYREMYAAESLLSAHAGFSTLHPYVFEDTEGTIGVVHEPDVDEGVRYGRLRIAAVLTALLAKWTWDRVGLDGGRFDDIEGLGDPT